MWLPIGVESVTSLRLRRVSRPNPAELEVLAASDREVFGSVALDTYDLAVVAEAGGLYQGEVVGSCQLLRKLSEPEVLWVLGFYIRPEWQSRGMGRALLEAITRELPVLGAQGMVLTVAPENKKAMELYLNFGFRVVEEVGEFYGKGEDRYLLRYGRE